MNMDMKNAGQFFTLFLLVEFMDCSPPYAQNIYYPLLMRKPLKSFDIKVLNCRHSARF